MQQHINQDFEKLDIERLLSRVTLVPYRERNVLLKHNKFPHVLELENIDIYWLEEPICFN